MDLFILKGRCNQCSQQKKVLKFNSPHEERGLCRKCLKELSEHPKFK